MTSQSFEKLCLTCPYPFPIGNNKNVIICNFFFLTIVGLHKINFWRKIIIMYECIMWINHWPLGNTCWYCKHLIKFRFFLWNWPFICDDYLLLIFLLKYLNFCTFITLHISVVQQTVISGQRLFQWSFHTFDLLDKL